jgi:hypothetical protein
MNEATSTRLPKFYLSYMVLVVFSTVLSITHYNFDLYHSFSYRWRDLPKDPQEFTFIPVFYGHYFGDFQTNVLFSFLSNPYRMDLTATFGQIPTALPILRFFGYFGLKIGFVLFSLLSISLIWIAIYRSTSQFRIRTRVFISCLLSFTSFPFLISIDRGNFIVIAVGCLFILVQNKNLEKNTSFLLTFTLVMISTSIKIYLILPLILFMIIWKSKTLFYAIILLGMVNLCMTFRIPGGLSAVYRNISNTLELQLGIGNIHWIQEGFGLNRFFSNIYAEYLCRADEISCLQSYQRFAMVPAVLWIVCATISIYGSKNNCQLYQNSIILLGVVFIPPVAMTYTLVVVIFIFCLFLSHNIYCHQVHNRSLETAWKCTLIILNLVVPVFFWKELYLFTLIALLVVTLFTLRKTENLQNNVSI